MEAVGMESHVPSNPKVESWTEEKHVHFLNSMEAWFVHTMLENNDRYTLRLDRHLPDTCESTLDSKLNVHKRNNYATSAVDFIGTKGSKRKGRPGKRSRRPSQQHHSFQDQVIPQLQNRRQDKDERHPPPPSMP